MSERRHETRADSPDRRSFPRPPLWLNLLRRGLGIAGLLFGRYHKGRVNSEFADVLTEQQRTPNEVRKAKEDLAEMNLTRADLQKELEARMKFVASLKSEDFYLSVNREEKKLRFYYGDTVLREADVTIGEEAVIPACRGGLVYWDRGRCWFWGWASSVMQWRPKRSHFPIRASSHA